MFDEIRSLLASLRSQTYTELKALPDHDARNIVSRGKRLTISVWTDCTGPGVIRVVVQGYRPLFLGIGQMGALGFETSEDGTIRDLSTDELYEFR